MLLWPHNRTYANARSSSQGSSGASSSCRFLDVRRGSVLMFLGCVPSPDVHQTKTFSTREFLNCCSFLVLCRGTTWACSTWTRGAACTCHERPLVPGCLFGDKPLQDRYETLQAGGGPPHSGTSNLDSRSEGGRERSVECGCVSGAGGLQTPAGQWSNGPLLLRPTRERLRGVHA